MTATPKTIRPLLIAESCNPEWVSIPLEGWSHARAIAQLTDAHLVTQVRNRPALLRAGLVEGKDFTSIDSESIARPLYAAASLLRGGKGKGWTTTTALSALAYPYFEHLLWKKFERRIRAGEFDLIHRLTPLSPTVPSLLTARCAERGVPFIIGPLNGGVSWPRGFDAARRKEKEWLSYVRDVYRLLPGYCATRANAAAILAGSFSAFDQVPRAFRRKTFYVAENAIDPARFTVMRAHRAALPLRAVFVGRLVPYKGADMLLEAAAPLLKSGALALDIIGDGPQMPELRVIVEREDIASSVQLHGWVPHEQLQQWLARADLFAFPSIREFGGAVILEAMAVGLAPIVVNYGGPGELVTDETGYRIPLGSRAQIIQNLRRILIDLVSHPESIESRAAAAIDRARTCFTWQAKAQRVVEIYRWVLDCRVAGSPRSAPPPTFPECINRSSN